MTRIIGGLVVIGALVASCGDGDSASLAYRSLRGEAGGQTIQAPRQEDLVACERTPGCGNVVLATAHSSEEAVRWMKDLPVDAIKVDFGRQMAVIWRGLGGTSYEYSVESVVNGSSSIVIHARLCRVQDVVVFNFPTRIAIAMDKSDRPVVVESRTVWDADNLTPNTQGFPVERCKKVASQVAMPRLLAFANRVVA